MALLPQDANTRDDDEGDVEVTTDPLPVRQRAFQPPPSRRPPTRTRSPWEVREDELYSLALQTQRDGDPDDAFIASELTRLWAAKGKGDFHSDTVEIARRKQMLSLASVLTKQQKERAAGTAPENIGSRQQILREAARGDSENLLRWLSDPINRAASEDDWSNLYEIYKSVDPRAVDQEDRVRRGAIPFFEGLQGEGFSRVYSGVAGGVRSSQRFMGYSGLVLGLGDEESIAEFIAQSNRSDPRQSDNLQRRMESAAPEELVGHLINNPWEATAMMGESLAFSLSGFIGQALGTGSGTMLAKGLAKAIPGRRGKLLQKGVLSTAGALGGRVTGQSVVEVGAWVEEQLQARGINASDKDELLRFMKTEEWGEVKAEALTKGLTQSAYEGTLGVFVVGQNIVSELGRIPFQRNLVKKAVALGGAAARDVGAGAVAGASGELTGQVAALTQRHMTQGEGFLPSFGTAIGGGPGGFSHIDVALEGLLDIGNTVGTTALNLSRKRATDTPLGRVAIRKLREGSDAVADAARHTKLLKNWGASRKQKRLAERLPGQLAGLLEGELARESGEPPAARIEYDAYMDYWKSQGLDEAEARAKTMEIFGKRAGKRLLNEGHNTGHIVIPIGPFANRLYDSEHMEGLIRISRFRSDGLTLGEAEADALAREARRDSLVAALGEAREGADEYAATLGELSDKRAELEDHKLSHEDELADKSLEEMSDEDIALIEKLLDATEGLDLDSPEFEAALKELEEGQPEAKKEPDDSGAKDDPKAAPGDSGAALEQPGAEVPRVKEGADKPEPDKAVSVEGVRRLIRDPNLRTGAENVASLLRGALSRRRLRAEISEIEARAGEVEAMLVGDSAEEQAEISEMLATTLQAIMDSGKYNKQEALAFAQLYIWALQVLGDRLGERARALFDEFPIIFTGDKTASRPDALEAQRQAQASLPQEDLPETIEVDGVSRPTTNSDGNPIHPGGVAAIRKFWRWFGDSKAVDEQGRPLVVYHGTPDAGFTTFKDGMHFSESGEYASVYTGTSASSGGVKKAGEAPGVYAVYLSIANPLDTRSPEARRAFEDEFFGKWGNRTPLSERGLPDWTDARDLLEWIEETGQPFDGLLVDEGGTPEGGSRGLAWVPV